MSQYSDRRRELQSQIADAVHHSHTTRDWLKLQLTAVDSSTFRPLPDVVQANERAFAGAEA